MLVMSVKGLLRMDFLGSCTEVQQVTGYFYRRSAFLACNHDHCPLIVYYLPSIVEQQS